MRATNGRRTVAWMAAAIAAAALTAASSAPASAATPCATRGSKTVVATKTARVFKVRVRPRIGAAFSRYYGCLFSRNRRFRFAEDDFPEQSGWSHIRLAGAYVAYAWHGSCAACDRAPRHVVVQSLRSGRFVTRLAISSEDTAEDRTVTDLELRPTGSVAWINRVGAGPAHEVQARDGAGARLLDSGPGIDPLSLALGGSTLYWTKAGVAASARLE